jgi:hypothetical protein
LQALRHINTSGRVSYSTGSHDNVPNPQAAFSELRKIDASRPIFGADTNRAIGRRARQAVRCLSDCQTERNHRGRSFHERAASGFNRFEPATILLLRHRTTIGDSHANDVQPNRHIKDEIALTISPEKVRFIIMKAREFDAKD